MRHSARPPVFQISHNTETGVTRRRSQPKPDDCKDRKKIKKKRLTQPQIGNNFFSFTALMIK